MDARASCEYSASKIAELLGILAGMIGGGEEV